MTCSQPHGAEPQTHPESSTLTLDCCCLPFGEHQDALGGLPHHASGQSPSSTHMEAAGRSGCLPPGHTGTSECEDQCSLVLVSKVGVRKVISLSAFKSDPFKLSTSLSFM